MAQGLPKDVYVCMVYTAMVSDQILIFLFSLVLFYIRCYFSIWNFLLEKENVFKIKVYDKKGTTEDKHEKYIMPFNSDSTLCEGRSTAWIKAWKEAKAELQDRKWFW